jgi:hypothetical protein
VTSEGSNAGLQLGYDRPNKRLRLCLDDLILRCGRYRLRFAKQPATSAKAVIRVVLAFEIRPVAPDSGSSVSSLKSTQRAMSGHHSRIPRYYNLEIALSFQSGARRR